MKKLLSLILCGVLVLGITGCGKESDQEKMVGYLESIGYECDGNGTCTIDTNEDYSYSMVMPTNAMDLENAQFNRIYDNGDKIEIFVAAYSVENLAAIYTSNNGEKYKLYDENTNLFKKGKYVLCDHYEDEKRDACDLIWLDVNETKEMLEDIFIKAEIDLAVEE